MSPHEALLEAVKRAGGTPAALATRLGGKVQRQHVEYWLKRGRTPAEHCPSIERETGVRCEALEPSVAWGVLRCSCNSRQVTDQLAEHAT